jgi:hypothetical protein
MPNFCGAKIAYTHDAPPVNVAETEDRLSKLSIRARKLYARLCNGEWYSWADDNTPHAMLELLAARLATTIVRAPAHAVYFAPHDAVYTSKEIIVNASHYDPRFYYTLRMHQEKLREAIAAVDERIARFREFETAHRLIGVE